MWTYEILKSRVKCDIQMKATEQYFPVVLFIMLFKVVLTFLSVDKISKCDHSNESFSAVLSLVFSLVIHFFAKGFWDYFAIGLKG